MNAKLLRGAMVEVGYNAKTMAQSLGMAPKTFYSRINEHTQFTTGEISKICDLLKIDDAERKCKIFLE